MHPGSPTLASTDLTFPVSAKLPGMRVESPGSRGAKKKKFVNAFATPGSVCAEFTEDQHAERSMVEGPAGESWVEVAAIENSEEGGMVSTKY